MQNEKLLLGHCMYAFEGDVQKVECYIDFIL